MAKSYRIARLNGSIKALLGELIEGSLKDPRIGFVTITAVDVARDLETAKVYYTVLGDDGVKEESRQGLVSARSFLRKRLGQELKLRNAPELRFIYDDSLDRSEVIEDAIKKIHNENQKDDYE